MHTTEKEDRQEQYRIKAAELVSQMTLEEKVLQTIHSSAAIERLGIKAYNWWNEALHGVARAGVATVFPQAIGLAATFDEDLLQQVGDVISTEGRGKYNMQQKYGDRDIYKGLTFWSPNVNIFRDPRWGRGHETYGEDPFLSGRMGVRFIKGLQGDDGRYLKAAACAKHFAVHSGPEHERHSFNAVVSKQDLYETYLPAFRECVKEAKVEAVMGAYNRLNGEPCCGSKTLLQDILRDEWGFEGHVVSDCGGIADLHEYHKVTRSSVESVAMALKHGCDLNCGNQFLYLEKAVKEGLVSETKLDEAVINLYVAKMKLGIIGDASDNPYNNIPYEVVDCREHREFNLEVAMKSLVLLKNQHNFLPLSKDKIRSIGIIGPNANNRKALVGNYEGTASRYITVVEGIQDYVGDDVRVHYSEGCHLYKDRTSSLANVNDRLSEVKGVCEQSDIIIACLGLDADLEGEQGDQCNAFDSGDKPNLNLPGLQQEVLEIIHASSKPVVLVMLSGSAMALNWAENHVPAIIQGWYPGAQGGKAIAKLIFGEYSPEGKLPVTFYKTTEELPDMSDYRMKNRTYRYMIEEPLYPFGYGLSYTEWSLSDVSISHKAITTENPMILRMVLRNTGKYNGAESIQVYVKCMQSDTPNPQLKALKKVRLKAGESQLIQMELPTKAFGLYNKEGVFTLYKGIYRIFIGTGQPDRRTERLTDQKSVMIEVKSEITCSIQP
ncbi:glycoside hydrolase family 3 C-terminal domain-containing protein [Vallitalea pronyensis]|uniref:Glycoside hydrolase family 3 C-terminal domain-containing protein n=1 Tax=Vallitalea pronyensis TaxID=1348613 RepID=A0A8J8MQ07_9FIRM|nr:glycoside hydrolase family 3 C-terminal domain-containing protein [Vallitalea pronyensis]QUI25621.1 glycoside hydrolase family 3 C-terminal domain-containing protein [Vallitalea pronyensis]